MTKSEKKLIRQQREHAARVGTAAVQILDSSSLSPFRRRITLAEAVAAGWYARFRYVDDARGLTGVAAAREVWDPHIGLAHDELGTAVRGCNTWCGSCGPRTCCARGRSPAASAIRTARRSASTTTPSRPDPLNPCSGRCTCPRGGAATGTNLKENP